MFRRLIRFLLASAALGGAGFAVFKVVQSRRSGNHGMPSGDDSIMPTRSETPLVEPSLMDGLDLRKPPSAGDNGHRGETREVETPVAKAAGAPATATATEPAPVSQGGQAWVEPGSGGNCPSGYPIKAKLASGIFHAPGMLAYDRTTPDRCYRDEASAEADGLRKAKR